MTGLERGCRSQSWHPRSSFTGCRSTRHGSHKLLKEAKKKQTFAERGYLVLEQAVPRNLVDAARRKVGMRVVIEPPPASHIGPCSYFLAGAPAERQEPTIVTSLNTDTQFYKIRPFVNYVDLME